MVNIQKIMGEKMSLSRMNKGAQDTRQASKTVV